MRQCGVRLLGKVRHMPVESVECSVISLNTNVFVEPYARIVASQHTTVSLECMSIVKVEK